MTERDIREWVERAEHDFDTVLLLVREQSTSYEIICFHCQQCVEKLLKAILTKEDIVFPRIHDLVKLANICLDKYSFISDYLEVLSELNEYAVAGRYPGEIVDIEDVEEAVNITKKVRPVLLGILGVNA